MAPIESAPLVSTGIAGLDEILNGGLPAHRVHLIEGDPGTGKTTLALQFLYEGLRRGERCLFVSLSETGDELGAVARSHGWTLDGISLHELTPSEGVLRQDEQYTLFHPSEVELSETISAVIEQVDRVNPSRVVIDSLSEMRLLAREPLRYRRQILALKQFFVGRRATVLLLDDRTSPAGHHQLQSISHGVIRLEQRPLEFGAERRRLIVVKARGLKYRGGYHDVRIETGGLRVYPRLAAAEHRGATETTAVSSGIQELDDLLGGGLNTGTSTLILGPAGVGKTSLAAQYAAAMACQGRRSAIYIFDERLNTFLLRTARLGLDLPRHVREGTILVDQIDPAQLTPGEFTDHVRQRVERDGVRLVFIDSLNGYLNAMQEESAVVVQLHELLSFLNQKDVLTLMVVAQHGVLGTGIASPLDVSYLADTLILLRYFEAEGAVHKAISVVKKRTGNHERTIREFRITSTGLRLGPPLVAFRGVLTGVPEYMGPAAPLLRADDVAS